MNETVELLAKRGPKLRQALQEAQRTGMAYVIIDGTLIPIDRIAADRPFYSGKHRRHGMNPQVIASPDGTILWVSGQLPGSTHDTAAARIWNILAALRHAGLIALGDKGYHGYDPTGKHVITPYKGRNKPESQKDANHAPRPTTRPRRARQRPTQDLAHPAQTPLLRADVELEIPPAPSWFTGQRAVIRFLAGRVLRTDRWRLVPTRANGQPAAVTYEHADDGRYQAHGVQVLTLIGTRIARITAFNDPALVPTFRPAPARTT